MRTFVKSVLAIMILSLVCDIIVIFESFYPLGEMVKHLFGMPVVILGRILGVLTLVGNSLWLGLISISIYNKFINK